ncbi:alpha/beta hydrolase [Enemella dayhoffiae]|uniref:Alpha/beta hydrolase n=2 Tax=Enemella dayhoffiae TaxID=2016507 RepID=A0A255H8T8_9ACTN|nr:alpha/beta hydrolase [Enemella dayhoffiae]
MAQGFGLVTGIAALAAGAVATGWELERRLVAQRFKRRRELPGEAFFTLRAPGPEVVTSDGVRLHVEVDPPPKSDAGVTVVLVHGYVLSLHCWHFQRKHFRGTRKVVLYDQRSHGRSGRSKARFCRIDQLAKDLKRVLDATTEPDEPVILVGHSMGGMTIQAFARQYPKLIGTKVVGAALLATSSGDLKDHSIIPGVSGEVFPMLAQPVLSAANRVPALVERSRRVSTDVSFVVTRRMSFGSDVPAEYVHFMSEMVAATPMEVVGDFYPTFAEFDGSRAMPILGRIEMAVIGGASDSIVPVEHTQAIIDQLPGADALIVPESGHMGIIEHHQAYDEVLDHLVERVERHL